MSKITHTYTAILCLFILFLNIPLNAQVTFSDQASTLNIPDFHSGVAIAVTDVNGDHYDDIIRLNEGRNLYIEFQQANGSFSMYSYGNIAGGSQWSMCVADADNNGFGDVFTGGSYDGIKYVQAGPTGIPYTMSNLPGPGMFIQGSNYADINNDGWLDVFACHDDGESRIWANDGSGSYNEANDWIDMATVPSSDNSGNYGSVWSDFDGDGDLDLYIAKCRQGVLDSGDPRRINALYVNDGSGNFTEQGAEYGLRIGAQSWTADFADIDNDGDMDCFITNHDVPSMLLENDGTGHFTDITEGSGIDIDILPIQGIMRDFDNDGFVDLLIAGGDERFFFNDGDGTFTEAEGLFDNEDMESFAMGDVNHDGFMDIYGGYANIYTSPTSVNDRLWINSGNDNNFLTVNLVGTQSNRDGIGAWVEIYGPWGIQVREVRAGESYGIVNSSAAHFGLGTADHVDSLIVKWPSGIVDMVESPAINDFITLIENNCVAPAVNITSDAGLTICSGDVVTLSAPEGYLYSWSTGEISQEIEVGEAGSYSVSIFDGTGCFNTSAPVTVQLNPDETPSISADGETEFCSGVTLSISSTEALAYEWSTGDTEQSIEVSESGDYFVTITGLCDNFSSDIITVTVFEAASPIAVNDTAYGPEETTLVAIGENLFWYDTPSGGTALFNGPEFTTPVITSTTSFWVEDLAVFDGGIFNGAKENNDGGGGENPSAFNGKLIFDAFEPFTLVSAKVYAFGSGNRNIELKDADGNILEEAIIDIPDGESRIDLNFNIPAGTEMTIGCANDPSLFRNNEDVSYPYDIAELGSIYNSTYGEGFYYYFYDWEIEKEGRACTSERNEVLAVYSDPVGISDPLWESYLDIFPNPANDFLQIRLDKSVSGHAITILSADGRLMQNINNTRAAQSLNLQIDISTYPAGLYILQLHNGSETISRKFSVQH